MVTIAITVMRAMCLSLSWGVLWLPQFLGHHSHEVSIPFMKVLPVICGFHVCHCGCVSWGPPGSIQLWYWGTVAYTVIGTPQVLYIRALCLSWGHVGFASYKGTVLGFITGCCGSLCSRGIVVVTVLGAA